MEGELSGEELEGVPYKDQLSALGLSPSEKWRLGSIVFCSFLRWECGEGRAGLLSLRSRFWDSALGMVQSCARG